MDNVIRVGIHACVMLLGFTIAAASKSDILYYAGIVVGAVSIARILEIWIEDVLRYD